MNIVKELEKVGQKANLQSYDSVDAMLKNLNISKDLQSESTKKSDELYCLVEFGANNADI